MRVDPGHYVLRNEPYDASPVTLIVGMAGASAIMALVTKVMLVMLIG
jgi:hypothetical protein